MLVDSHAHLDHERYEGELELILSRAWEAGVGSILSIGIGDGPSSMDRALGIARKYRETPKTPRIYASAGVHPQEAALCDALALANLDALLAEPEVIACGEIGLDFYHADNPPVAVQREAFRAQMELAARHRKPILIHCRPGSAFGPENEGDGPVGIAGESQNGKADGGHNGSAGGEQSEVQNGAWSQTLAMLEEHWRPTGLGGVLHCFTGEAHHAEQALSLGFMLSFAGNLTYPSAAGLREIAANAPADRILVETDCPFLAPVPDRGKRNEPAFVARTAATLAQLRGLETEALAELTSANFCRFFHTADSVAPA